MEEEMNIEVEIAMEEEMNFEKPGIQSSSPKEYGEPQYWYNDENDDDENEPRVGFFQDLVDTIDDFKDEFGLDDNLCNEDDEQNNNDSNKENSNDFINYMDEFHMRDEIDRLLKANTSNKSNIFWKTEYVPLYEGSTISTKEFTDKMLFCFRKGNLSSALISSIFRTIHECIPILNLLDMNLLMEIPFLKLFNQKRIRIIFLIRFKY